MIFRGRRHTTFLTKGTFDFPAGSKPTCGARRIAIIGCPGSGKTWLARELAARTGLPQHSLDDHYWNRGWRATPSDAWSSVVKELVARDSWIIDGNYLSSMQERVRAAELVVFLDVPVRVAFLGVLWRYLVQLIRPDRALPRQMAEQPSWPDRFHLAKSLLRFVLRFPLDVRPQVVANLAKAAPLGTHVLVFRRRSDACNWVLRQRPNNVALDLRNRPR